MIPFELDLIQSNGIVASSKPKRLIVIFTPHEQPKEITWMFCDTSCGLWPSSAWDTDLFFD